MSGSELAALSRAHELFAGTTREVALDARLAPYDGLLERAAGLNTGGGHELYQSAVATVAGKLCDRRRRLTPRWPPPRPKPTGITPTLAR